MHEPNSAPWALSMRVPPVIAFPRRGGGVMTSCAHSTSHPNGPRGRSVRPYFSATHFRRFLARSATGALP